MLTHQAAWILIFVKVRELIQGGTYSMFHYAKGTVRKIQVVMKKKKSFNEGILLFLLKLSSLVFRSVSIY